MSEQNSDSSREDGTDGFTEQDRKALRDVHKAVFTGNGDRPLLVQVAENRKAINLVLWLSSLACITGLLSALQSIANAISDHG